MCGQNAEHLRQTCLRIQIDDQHPVAVQTQVLGEVGRGGGLGHAALEIADRDDQRALAGRAPGRDAEGPLQPVDFLEREFAPTRVDLHALRQGLVLLQPPVERVDRDVAEILAAPPWH